MDNITLEMMTCIAGSKKLEDLDCLGEIGLESPFDFAFATESPISLPEKLKNPFEFEVIQTPVHKSLVYPRQLDIGELRRRPSTITLTVALPECNHLTPTMGAAPKGILRAIYYVNSHLQKYRISKFIPETNRGKYERRNISEILPNFIATSKILAVELNLMKH
ncbi:myb family transcription factor [Salix suchowensis]|nr:myb family transcription factor [Salix suchowensis]